MRAVRLEIDQISQLGFPCIARSRMDHFVVIESVDRKGVLFMTPQLVVGILVD